MCFNYSSTNLYLCNNRTKKNNYRECLNSSWSLYFYFPTYGWYGLV